jgi:hypothetical protein
MASYGTDDGFAAWLAEQGYDLPDNAPAPAVLRARGSAYVDGYEAYWTGQRTGGVMQELGWPRVGAVLNCIAAIPDDAIPPVVVNAAYRAAWLEASAPGTLAGPAVTTGARVQSERVEGAVEISYFNDGKAAIGAGPSFVDSLIDGWLSAFICNDQKNAAFLWTLGS